LRTVPQIVESLDAVVQADPHTSPGDLRQLQFPTRAGVPQLSALSTGAKDVSSRAIAGVHATGSSQDVERGFVQSATIALAPVAASASERRDRRIVRHKPQPLEILEQGLLVLAPAALAVVILDAQQHGASGRLSHAPDVDGVYDVAEMEPSGRRGGEPSDGRRQTKPGVWTHAAPDDSVPAMARFHMALTVAVLAATLIGSTDLPLASQAAAPAPSFSVVEQDIASLQRALRDERITSRQIVEQYLARIDEDDQRGLAINAYLSVNRKALDDADRLDRERREGRLRGPLHGIPLAIKDNFLTIELPTTAGTLALADFSPGVDAYQIRQLRERGAIVLGKTNLHELASGITSVSSAGGQTRNPYDLERNPGGSSGGTAAAVAASLAPAGLGTDTCGSIRIPASHNNLWGLRPTHGLSSRDGVVPLSLSQDVAGPIARSSADLAELLNATVGFDEADPVTEASRGRVPRSYLEFMGDSSLVDVRIGVVTPLMGEASADEEVRRVVDRAIDELEGLGASVGDHDMLGLESVLRDTSAIAHEFSFNLQDFLARHKAPVRSLDEILRWGLYRTELDGVLRRWNETQERESEAYRTTRARRAAAKTFVLESMQGRSLTVLAYPTIRRKAARIGEQQEGSNCQMSATTGLPAISMPAGFTDDGMPVGLELLGTPFSEGTLLRIAYAYERQVHPRRAPRLIVGR